MANRRMTYIENGRVLADSGVLTAPIQVRDPISSLKIMVQAQNGASWNQANTLPVNVQAFELLDGANVILSLTGVQLQAMAIYEQGHTPFFMADEFPGSFQSLCAEIQFGRWLGDTVYSLDPSKYQNLQYRLTWNLATTRAVGATGYLTGTGLLNIVANIMEGAASPQGCLYPRQHYQFITTAAGITYIDLPTDRRIKSILVRSAANAWGGVPGISRVKITCDQDKFIPLDLLFQDFIEYACRRNPAFSYKHTFMIQNTTVIQPIMKWEEQVNLQGYQGDTVILYTNNGAGFGTCNQLTGGAADANMRSYAANVRGWAPYNSFLFDMGEFDDPSTWLDATKFGAVQLQLTNNLAASTASVVLESEAVY